MAGKNFRPVGQSNLTEITIRLCQEAEFFDDVLLSSDVENGEEMARDWGVKFHRRSPLAASDVASATNVLEDVGPALSLSGIREDDYLFYLQPTSPLRTLGLITQAWADLSESSYPGIVAVTEVETKYRKTLVVYGGRIRGFGDPAFLSANQQALAPLYLANGNLFAFRWGLFLESRAFPIEGLVPVVEGKEVSLDIDSEQDFESYCERIGLRA